VSRSRKERTLAQAERVVAIFDANPGGVSRGQLAMLADIPEQSVSRVMAHLRNHALDYEHVAFTLKIGGEWIYGWADALRDHMEEHKKRRQNEARSLRLSVETLAQSVSEQPESLVLRSQLLSAKHRLEDVELQVEALTGQLRLVRQETDAA
jgi:hypothetical protein